MTMRIIGLTGLFFSISSLHASSSYFSSLLSQTTQALKITQGSGIGFIIVAFLAGVLTSLLPCIYPMIPITVGILQGQGAKSVGRNFQLALAYVNGMALVYAMLGYLCAKSAVLFGSWLGSPWFVGAIVLFFLYLAGSMLGLYEAYIPAFLQSPVTRIDGGSVSHCFLLGMIAATVASPCLAPPLAILIGLVAKAANPILGFIALYAFSLGMGMLLLFVGTFSGAIGMLPRAGAWLDVLKQALGFVLLGVSVYFVQPLVGIRTAQGLYASVLLAALWTFSYQLYVARSRKGEVLIGRLIIAFAVLLTAVFGMYFKTIFLGAVALVS
jgi:thioredoxin:protein disulfide reductase